jgi:site-specific DNA-methyltransferase (adenine-specific)
MNLVSINSITVQERQRRTIDDARVADLAESIFKVGLLHAPVCRHGVHDEIILVVGEGRLRAMRLLHEQERSFNYLHTPVDKGMFPFLFYEELDPVTAKEVELEENISRVDLTWQDRAAAIAELHTLKVAGDTTWSQADTARVAYGKPVNVTQGVRDKIILANNLHRPEIRTAKTEKEALKILSKTLEDEFRMKLGEMQARVSGRGMTLVQSSAIEYLSSFQAAFDIILTDPPYGVDADTFDAEMIQRHLYEDSWSSVSRLLREFAKSAMTATKAKAHLYMFCDVRRFMDLHAFFTVEGWDVWPKPLVWVKDVGHLPMPHYGPRYMYETILFANKGKRCVTGLYPDVIIAPADKGDGKMHAAQKPVDIYLNLLRRSCSPGDVVIDPFCGSGPIFPAAHELQLIAYGCDIDPASVSMAAERIAKL